MARVFQKKWSRSGRTSWLVILVLGGGIAATIALSAASQAGRAPASAAGSVDSPEALEARRLFDETVAPRLAGSCAGREADGTFSCHAQPTARYEQLQAGDAHPDNAINWFFPVDGETGELVRPAGFDAAYQKLLAGAAAGAYERMHFVDRSAPARFSLVVRKPLTETAGGVNHTGGEVFTTTADPLYRAMTRWIEAERRARPEPDAALAGGEAGRFYKERVLPLLLRNMCMAPSCHEFNHSNLRFDPGVASEDVTEPLETRFTNAIANTNRKTSIGLITNQLFFSGDVSLSRFIRKALPIAAGGTLHKGGNHLFLDGTDDPDFKTLVEWVRLERRELLAHVRIAGEPVAEAAIGKLRGVVYVRSPRQNHREFLDVGRYLPGSDLWLLKLREGETLATATGTPVNLTARFHEGRAADIREPDLRYDGRAIVFAMRVGEEDNLDVYEIELDQALDYVPDSFRRLTFGPEHAAGVRVHFTDPTYVPAADDENAALSGYNLDRADLVFASNLAGEVAPIDEYGVLGEADGGDATTILDWERFEPDGSFVGRRVHVLGKDGQPTATRRITGFDNRTDGPTPEPSTLTLDAPLPAPPESGVTHYVIDRPDGVPPRHRPAYAVYGIQQAPRGAEERTYQTTLARITWSPNHELDLSVRSTGEVYFASLRNTGYSGGKPVWNVGRNRRQLDKAFSFPTHRGNRSRIRIYADYHELPAGNDIFVALSPDTVWGSGALHVGDHQLGCSVETGNPVDSVNLTFQGHGKPGEGERQSHPRAVPAVEELFPRVGPRAVTDAGVSPGGTYRDPRPMPTNTLLVSYAPGPLVLSDPAARPDFDLYLLDADPSFNGGHGGLDLPETRLVPIPAASSPDFAEIQAVPVAVRFKERMRGARRPEMDRYIQSPEADKTDERPGLFCEQNYLAMDAFIDENVPVGKRIAYDVDPVTGRPLDEMAKVVYIRIVEGLPWSLADFQGIDAARIANGDAASTRVANGIHPAKRVMAEVAVEEDGKVCLPVAGNTPFIYQSLNKDRMALRSLNRWFFVAPNEFNATSASGRESFQQCAACHGSMTGRAVDTYGVMDYVTPGGCGATCHGKAKQFASDGTGAVGSLATAPIVGASDASTLEARIARGETMMAPASRLMVTFARDIQPILDAHCVACHAGDSPAAALDLTGTPTTYFSRAYESLMALADPDSGDFASKRYVAEREALAIESYLVEKLFGRELRAPRALEGDAPHPSAALIARLGVDVTPLDEAQRLRFIRWIDLGAVFTRGAFTEGSSPTP